MKNILAIFISDIKALSKRFFALAIICAITVLPALYAWFNIFANHDPYGSTGNIKIACASDDLGYEDLEGESVNMGEKVIAELAEKDNINFIPYSSSDDAIRAAESGECYAAIVIHKDFTRSMYDLSAALSSENEVITFYENCKLNAVANKITETAASTVQQTIQVEYLNVLYETVFGKIDKLFGNVDTEESGENVLDAFCRMRDSTRAVSDALAQFSSDSLEFADDLNGISTEGISEKLSGVESAVDASGSSLENVRASYLALSAKLAETVDRMLTILETPETTAAGSGQLKTEAENLLETAASLNAVTPEYYERINEGTEEFMTTLSSATDGGATPSEQVLNNMRQDLKNIKALRGSIDNTITSYFDLLTDLSDNLSPVINSLSRTVSSIDPTMRSAADTLYALDGSMVYLRIMLDELEKTLDRIIENLEAFYENGTLSTLADMLEGDSSAFAEFFSCPVTVKTEALYPVKDYGTAMAPFYSTLAIWVGCVILGAIIKAEADPRKLKNVTENQLFFARFLLYLILSEIQTVIIVMGDVYILGVDCISLGKLWFASAVTSFVFTCLIYSLILAFGDIGKAIVVVIMVLQIAGSGGTYPIEILEPVFSKLYLFFPFPYAIEAMREAICGFYANDYWIYLGELMIFGVLGLIIGLFVRRPFIDVNKYVEEEMHGAGVF